MSWRQFITEVHHSVSEDSPNLHPHSTLHAELDKQDKSKGLLQVERGSRRILLPAALSVPLWPWGFVDFLRFGAYRLCGCWALSPCCLPVGRTVSIQGKLPHNSVTHLWQGEPQSRERLGLRKFLVQGREEGGSLQNGKHHQGPCPPSLVCGCCILGYRADSGWPSKMVPCHTRSVSKMCRDIVYNLAVKEPSQPLQQTKILKLS